MKSSEIISNLESERESLFEAYNDLKNRYESADAQLDLLKFVKEKAYIEHSPEFVKILEETNGGKVAKKVAVFNEMDIQRMLTGGAVVAMRTRIKYASSQTETQTPPAWAKEAIKLAKRYDELNERAAKNAEPETPESETAETFDSATLPTEVAATVSE